MYKIVFLMGILYATVLYAQLQYPTVKERAGIYQNDHADLKIMSNGSVILEYADESCMGNFEGLVIDKDRQVLYIESSQYDKDGSGCYIQIKGRGTNIEVTESECNYYHGENCSFSGMYRKQNTENKKSIKSSSVTWQSLGIGVENPGEINDWVYFGIKTPQEAAAWIKALKPLGGISYSGAARLWKQKGYDVSETALWILQGVKNPDRADYWKRVGVMSPEIYRAWRQLLLDDIEAWIHVGIKSPKQAQTWVNVGITSANILGSWLDAGVKDPKDFIAYQTIGVKDYHVLKEWHRIGVDSANKIQAWKNVGIQTPQEAYRWIENGAQSPEEIKQWKDTLGIVNTQEYKKWKQSVGSIGSAKEWKDAGYQVDEVVSQVVSGNKTPSDVMKSRFMNIFWLLVLGGIGVWVYRALELKCPKCKSKDYVEIDRQETFKGFQQYRKKGDNYKKTNGLSQTRGRFEKVEEVIDVKTTYRCNECGHVFIKKHTETYDV